MIHVHSRGLLPLAGCPEFLQFSLVLMCRSSERQKPPELFREMLSAELAPSFIAPEGAVGGSFRALFLTSVGRRHIERMYRTDDGTLGE